MQLLIMQFTIKVFLHLYLNYDQELHLKYLCNLARYWLQTPWRWHDSVETCRNVIIWEIIVHLLVLVRNNKRCTVHGIKISWGRIFEHKKERGRRAWRKLRSEFFYNFFPFMPLLVSRTCHTFQVILTLRRLMSYIYIWSTHSWCF